VTQKRLAAFVLFAVVLALAGRWTMPERRVNGGYRFLTALIRIKRPGLPEQGWAQRPCGDRALRQRAKH
jgi:hypothetical protein